MKTFANDRAWRRLRVTGGSQVADARLGSQAYGRRGVFTEILNRLHAPAGPTTTGPAGVLILQPVDAASHAPASAALLYAGARPLQRGPAGPLFGIRKIANSVHLTMGYGQFDAKKRQLTAWRPGLRTGHSRQSPWAGRTATNDAQIRSAA